MRTFVVGTRQSHLAMTQTGHVIAALESICREQGLPYTFEVKKIVTKGDRILDVTLSKVGGKGLFVKEIEQALMDGEIDMAVHSMKDVPSELPEGFVLGAVPEREDPRDCLISRVADSLDSLPPGAKIGTSSLRRSSQLKAYRPDLQVEWIRGNIESRMRKLETDGFDAVILAAAGLHRVGWQDQITAYIPEDISIPAVGQGALGIECREDDREALSLLSRLHHAETAQCVEAERAFLARLNGGCQVPLGAYAELRQIEGKPVIELSGMVGSPDGQTLLREKQSGTEPAKLGIQVADKLLAQGAAAILDEVRGG
ncbi:porphobilinogen deaminase [Xylanibacillus composti]|uniref:Porphobilinogen deaminase n=1 Tax=Xylanibacillus composti TaxID=1572762 RepID=A0A8J4H3B5_9BACL|nr:hydroxymethylbilane synthase [Xylanibacillus composti]GIQ70198.1 porphobilinogen deaminase [Xylanibacillus composti]